MLPYSHWAPQSETAYQAARRANEARSAAFYEAVRFVREAVGDLATATVQLAARAGAWHRLRRAERHLASLDDRILRDIGIRRQDVRCAVRDDGGRWRVTSS